MTTAQKSLDSSEDSSYIDYMAAEIYGDASLLGRNDIEYGTERTTEQLDNHQRIDIFSTPNDNFKDL
jgi:hypothetical protein